MIEKCPYWREKKFTEGNISLNDLCAYCGKQNNCNVLRRLAQDPKVVKRSSGGFRKPISQSRTPYIVICKDCRKTASSCRCQNPSGYTLKKEESNG